MTGFGLLIGHLVGDYIVQTDWMSKSKTTSHLHCFVHCLCYTLAVWVFSFWWMPLWGLLACFAAHYPIDRFRLARLWMGWFDQEAFATGVFSPWSIVIVDNIFHLVTLWVIAMIAGVG